MGGRLIWKNGKILPETAAVMSIYDEGAMMGTNIFEMTRSFNKVPFKLRAHLERLQRSAEATHMPMPYTLAELEVAHGELLAANERAGAFAPDDEYRTLITVSRGPLPLYPHLRAEPWVMLTAYPLRWVLRGKSHWYREGVELLSWKEKAILPSVKHHSRIHFRDAELGAAPAIPLLIVKGWVAETTGANVFIYGPCDRVGARWRTPRRHCLPGISAQMVMELARQGARYDQFKLEDVLDAEEVMLTCTPFGILPVRRIDFENRPVGVQTTSLLDAWKNAVGCDFVEQAERWDAA